MFGVFACGVVAVVFIIDDVTITIVLFMGLFVTFDVAVDCVVLETTETLEELFTLTFRQTRDKLPTFVVSQCLVRFNVVPLHEGSDCDLFGEQISVKLMWITRVALAGKVEFCVVQFENVALHDVVALTAVEFCRVEFPLLDVVFTDDTSAETTVSFEEAPSVCRETQSGTKTVIATEMANT